MRQYSDSLTRRQLLKLACSTVAGAFLWGCQDKETSISNRVDSKLLVFHNGVVLPVDDAFSGESRGHDYMDVGGRITSGTVIEKT